MGKTSSSMSFLLRLSTRHFDFSTNCNSRYLMSTYGVGVKELFKAYRFAPPYASFGIQPAGEYDIIDMKRCYTTIVRSFKEFPKFGVYDTIRVYDGHPLKNWSVYSCRYVGERNNEMDIRFPAATNLMFGHQLLPYIDSEGHRLHPHVHAAGLRVATSRMVGTCHDSAPTRRFGSAAGAHALAVARRAQRRDTAPCRARRRRIRRSGARGRCRVVRAR